MIHLLEFKAELCINMAEKDPSKAEMSQ
jgi:hypothetical protein